MQNIQEVWENVASKRKITRIAYVVHMLIYVAALVLLVLKMEQAMLIVGLANAVAYLLVIRRMNKGYSDAVTNANIQYGLCAPLQDVQHSSKKGGMTDEAFRALEILPLYKNPTPGNRTLMCHNMLHARQNDLALACCEATLHYSYQNDGKRPLFRFLNGTLLTTERLPENSNRGDWLFLRQGLLMPSVQEAFLSACGYHPVACDAAAVSTFTIYTHSQADEVPDHLLHQLAAMNRPESRVAAVRLTADCAAVFVERLFTFRTRLYDLPTVQDLAYNPLPERDSALALFHYWAQLH